MKFMVVEGDMVETIEGLIFDVKGLIHPPSRIIAFIRYFPDKVGKRTRKGVTYGKVYSLSKRYDLLRAKFPQYLVYDSVLDETLCEVPTDAVSKLHYPVEKLRKIRNSKSLDPLEASALQLTKSVKKKAGIPWHAIGISGSIMVSLHTKDSDIDPVIYGSLECRKAHRALQNLLKDGKPSFRVYNREDLKTLFGFRSKDTEISFEDFVQTEARKSVQGKFQGRDFFVRFVKTLKEVKEKYGDVHYRNVGRARIRATVDDDSESIFTPCSYKIREVETIEGTMANQIVEIASFRGRFCEQAKTGETVVAQGKVELVCNVRENREYFRLLIGNKPSDFMILA